MQADHASGSSGVECGMQGDALVLTMSAPSKRNALSLAMRDQLRERLQRAQTDASRAIVLTGAKGYFSSGGDLAETGSPELESMRFENLREIATLLVKGSKPVVAAVEGGAFGVGLSLAAACDYVVVAEDARLGCPFVNVGLTGDGGVTWTLPRRVGHARARRMLLNGQVVDASTACEWGLADEAVSTGRALERALEVAAGWSRKAPLSIAATKKLLEFGAAQGLEQALVHEGLEQRRLQHSHDADEGRAAFRDKRPPKFLGR